MQSGIKGTFQALMTGLILTTLLSSTGHAQPLPDWPRPPSEQDCRAFQSAINEYYRQADEEYRRCSSQSTPCGDAPSRRGAASVRRSSISACFFAANQRSGTESAIEFLARDKKDDGVAALGQFAKDIHSVENDIRGVHSLRDRVRNYSSLSDQDKLVLHRDLARSLNDSSPNSALSRRLTEDALNHTTAAHQDAMAQLDNQLKRLEDRHRDLIGLKGGNGQTVPGNTRPAGSGLAGRVARSQQNEETASNRGNELAKLDASQTFHEKRGRDATAQDAADLERAKQQFVGQCHARNDGCQNRCMGGSESYVRAACSRVCSADLHVCRTSAYGDDDDLDRASLAKEIAYQSFRRAVNDAEAGRQRAQEARAAAEQMQRIMNFSSFPVFSRPAAPAPRMAQPPPRPAPAPSGSGGTYRCRFSAPNRC
jgi:hypothetical protein